MGRTYKDLLVWQKAVEVARLVYQLTEVYPKSEQYGLTSQMRRAAVSISSNIAEGKLRSTDKEFKRFLDIALGSAAELETQIYISRSIPSFAGFSYAPVEALLEEVMKMLNGLIGTLG